MGIVYATREDVMRAADSKETARNAAQIDRGLEAASRNIDALCHRTFYPHVATKSFDWPNSQGAAPWRLWLDANELISVSAVSSGGSTISLADVLLEPNAYGPPYNRLELDLSSSAAFGGGDTHQRDITITGLYGYRDDEQLVGDLDGSITSSATTLDVTAAPLIGVGSLLRIGTERLTVTAKAMRSTFVTTTAALIAKASDDVLTGVSAGFAVGETILVDGERMLIVDQSPTSLIVKRGWDGSTLAEHSLGATIYAPRTLAVTRGALGTTAASHTNGDDVFQWEPPGPVRTLAIAEVLNTLGLEQASYSVALRAGEAGSERTRDVRGLAALRAAVYDGFGRKARLRGI
ncbi:hypothetical protein [Streptomyces sp. NBC_01264]|uniref:hypothetical protein n=1 Tax=Streptomyces sp. NBC_01264 TaxID=2903804 RepID=UPI00225C1436|nr:hypothetical protein [Streptomyces sp. NBC_01264]MCX4778168.1 hypothetical protein [Streptomyces sp. NBC_01264]